MAWRDVSLNEPVVSFKDNSGDRQSGVNAPCANSLNGASWFAQRSDRGLARARSLWLHTEESPHRAGV